MTCDGICFPFVCVNVWVHIFYHKDQQLKQFKQFLDILHLRSKCKYFGRRVGTSLDDSHNFFKHPFLSTAVGLHGV